VVKLFFKRFAVATVLFCGLNVALYAVFAVGMATFRLATDFPSDMGLIRLGWWMMGVPVVLAATAAWIAEKIIKAPKPAVSEAGKPVGSISGAKQTRGPSTRARLASSTRTRSG
jgi:hypothetical protein